MEWKDWLLIIVVGYLVFWYMNPDKGKPVIDGAIDKMKAFTSGISNNAAQCPTQYDPVCANGVTYDNSCKAQKAGFNNMTAGVCQ